MKRIISEKGQKEIHILSSNDRLKFEKYLLYGQDAYKIGILLSLYTGIRIGELCALGNVNKSAVEIYPKFLKLL